MNLSDFAGNFPNADTAREFLEKQRWPNGVVCPFCGLVGEVYRLQPKPNTKTHARPGIWKCGGCRKQFTVTVGTIFEDSHIPLHKWLFAIHLLCASKKGMSAHQLHRMLGITYKSAWFMAHRIRHAMKREPLAGNKLSETVEVDETYVGGKAKGLGVYEGKRRKTHAVSLVQRGGDVRSFPVEHVSAKNLKPILRENIASEANVMTDDFATYSGLKADFPSHDIINRAEQKYVRREGTKKVHTNTVEGLFSLLKRGIVGRFHHVSRRHLHRYLAEFDFRYNARDIDDASRTLRAIKSMEGKRLMYRDAKSKKV